MAAPVSLPVQCLDVARSGPTALVRVTGLGNMHLAPTLQAFVDDGLAQQCIQVVVDLADCSGMDSTFMGTLVGLSLTLKEHEGWLCVLNVGRDNERLLRTLGVWEFIAVLQRPRPDMPPPVRLLPVMDAAQRLAQIHAAHKHLYAADDKNRARFGPFLEAVEREMAVMAKAQAEDMLAHGEDGLTELPAEAPPGAGASPELNFEFTRPDVPPAAPPLGSSPLGSAPTPGASAPPYPGASSSRPKP